MDYLQCHVAVLRLRRSVVISLLVCREYGLLSVEPKVQDRAGLAPPVICPCAFRDARLNRMLNFSALGGHENRGTGPCGAPEK